MPPDVTRCVVLRVCKKSGSAIQCFHMGQVVKRNTGFTTGLIRACDLHSAWAQQPCEVHHTLEPQRDTQSQSV